MIAEMQIEKLRCPSPQATAWLRAVTGIVHRFLLATTVLNISLEMLVALEDVTDETFDFVICGGGTAGLTLAARLSEDPDVSVLVLEAGPANLSDLEIPTQVLPCSFGAHFGKPQYSSLQLTTSQKCAQDQQYPIFRGVGLGGSSAINFMGWMRPSAQEINDIERLGNPGWNWDNYERHLRKIEGFVPSNEATKQQFGLDADNWALGRDGPVKLSYPGTLSEENALLHQVIDFSTTTAIVKCSFGWLQTLLNAGIPPAKLPYNGDPHGAFWALNNYDSKTHSRSYATTAFYLPNQHRQNLAVLVEAEVNVVLTHLTENGQYTATGVEFVHSSRTHVVHARKEVIISSGSLKSAQILELSGFGRKEILEEVGITVKVELPGVGENVQEHVLVFINFEVRDDADFNTPDVLRDPSVAAEHKTLHLSGQGWHTTGIVNHALFPLRSISTRAETIIQSVKDKLKENGASYPAGLLDQYKIQLERLENGAPDLEIIACPGASAGVNPPEPGKRYVTFNAAFNSCFSRGSIHITSDDPRQGPVFNPGYFKEDIDMEILFELVKFVRDFAQVAPIKDIIVGLAKERNPGPTVQSDEEIRENIKKNLSSIWHTASSCSMLPREKGGVVDPRLKVTNTEIMLVTAKDVAEKSFDYIICGGGTAGLALAARLTENPNTTVLVIEAGQANFHDPLILRPGTQGLHFGNPMYCWPYQTVKQKGLLDLKPFWFRGKGLGGSSSINFMAWTKPPANEINDWERLGNPGWNWQNFHRYLSRAEGFIPPSADVQQKFKINLDSWTLGKEGPVKISYPGLMNLEDTKFHETLANLGIDPAPLPLNGDPSGYFFAPNTIDPRTHTRSYATTAYYLPNKDRPNLQVLVSATVNQIITECMNGGKRTATGVEFYHDEQPYVVRTKKEVIVSAGSLKSPQILELSGIGDRNILGGIGVMPKVDLPGVGRNVQEHITCCMSFELREGVRYETLDVLRDPEEAKRQIELHKEGKGLHTLGVIGFAFMPLHKISDRADEIISKAKAKLQNNADKYRPGVLEQLNMQLERIKKGAPLAEVINFPGFFSGPNLPEQGKKYITLAAGLNQALSRGTIHSTSNDLMKEPEFDPQYFEEEIDQEIYFELIKFLRKLASTSPLKDIIVAERNPGLECQTDEDLLKWAKTFLSTTWHTASSCSMLPKEKDGVVDPELRVYGTENIRVVDLSVVPVHIDAHTQTSAYAIAEQAAAIIMGTFPTRRARVVP
ncbi:hypothetical protein CERSUDRAFT_91113 [Gelatoporia subvermispora B]|uniref:Glucose-methanol-choline oxidoreductase N-terminal domain-containing protein n=1 Tax=Ceriporiopsis subvermispora (strain B) TaxID=914234 RepID=M2QTL7_CERS8|nr:hypothetical protein CERSUDRAFT_91113 [Gelatoporia subvermispora B]